MGALAIIGGAGTGKTRALLESARELTPADSVLLLTFAPERLRPLLPDEVTVTTFDDLCAELLRDEAAIDPFAITVTQGDRLAMLLERIDDLPLSQHDLRGNPSAVLGTVIGRIDRLKDELITADDYAAWAATLVGDESAREREFAAIYAAHDRMLAEAGTLDAGDLVTTAFRTLRERPHVRARFSRRYRHVLVDDFHDTSFAQGLLLKLLTADNGNVTVAGDDDQAIFRFRGAATKNLRDFEGRGAHARAFPPGAPADPRRGARRRRAQRGPARQAARRGARRRLAFWRAANERAQAQATAADIERLITRDGVAPEDIAVLVRSASRARASRSPSRSRSAPSRTASPARPPSSSAPRCATCSPGCGCWSTRGTPAPWCARLPARRSSCAPSTSPA